MTVPLRLLWAEAGGKGAGAGTAPLELVVRLSLDTNQVRGLRRAPLSLTVSCFLAGLASLAASHFVGAIGC